MSFPFIAPLKPWIKEKLENREKFSFENFTTLPSSHGVFWSLVIKNKTPSRDELEGVLRRESGVDLLSRTVKCNIIGAEAFHGPVREGKGWFHLAMDTRLKRGAPGIG